jgi:hypothetical protein
VAWVAANGNKQPKTIGANFNDFRIFPSYSGRFYLSKQPWIKARNRSTPVTIR